MSGPTRGYQIVTNHRQHFYPERVFEGLQRFLLQSDIAKVVGMKLTSQISSSSFSMPTTWLARAMLRLIFVR